MLPRLDFLAGVIFGMLPVVYVSAVREVWQAAIVGPKPGMLNAVKKVGQAAIVHYNTSRHAQALAWQAAMGWAYSPNSCLEVFTATYSGTKVCCRFLSRVGTHAPMKACCHTGVGMLN